MFLYQILVFLPCILSLVFYVAYLLFFVSKGVFFWNGAKVCILDADFGKKHN